MIKAILGGEKTYGNVEISAKAFPITSLPLTL